jgi:hypothetical protein
MRLIQLHTLHRHGLHALPMVRHGPLGRDPLKTRDSFEIHGTDVGHPLIADAPALTFQELFHRRFGELAPGHQGPLSLGELTATDGAAQPLNVLVLARPGAMDHIVSVRLIAQPTSWIGARKSPIPFLRWRRQYHSGPPVVGNGPQDTNLTPVVPCYYSPGLPIFTMEENCSRGPLASSSTMRCSQIGSGMCWSLVQFARVSCILSLR